MKNCGYRNALLLGIAFIGLFAYLLVFIINARSPSLEEHGRLLSNLTTKRLAQLEQLIQDAIDAVEKEKDGNVAYDFWNYEFFLRTFDADFTLFVYSNDSLIFWNNTENFGVDPGSLLSAKGMLENRDGLFLYANGSSGDYRYFVIEPVYLQYPIRNQYVRNGFSSRFDYFNDKIKIINEIDSNSSFKCAINDDFIVQIDYVTDQAYVGQKNLAVSTDLIISVLLIFLYALHRSIKGEKFQNYQKAFGRYSPLMFSLLFLSIILISGKKIFPDISSDTDEFFPTVLHYEIFPASWSLLFLFFAIYLVHIIQLYGFKKLNPTLRIAFFSTLLIVSTVLIEMIFSHALLRSTFPEAALNGNNISLSLAIKLIGLFLLSVSGIYLTANLLLFIRQSYSSLKSVLLLVMVSWLMVGMIWVFYEKFFVVLALLPLAILAFRSHERASSQLSFDNSSWLMMWMIFSIGLAFTYSISNQRVADEEQILTAKKLSSDKDPLLEFLFSDLNQQWMQDSLLNSLIFDETVEDQKVNTYIRNNYLQGYLARYETEVTTCYADQDLILQPENRKVNCISYFNSLLDNRGDSLRPGGIYLIDNNLLGVHYVGYLLFDEPNKSGLNSLHVFIEFFNKFIPEGTGYPDLLIDADRSIGPDLNKYSFATYREGTLYYKFGSYFFPLRLDLISPSTEGFFNRDGYRHAVLKYSDKILIISRKNKGWAELLAPFSFFLLVNGLLVIFIKGIQEGFPNIRKSFATFRTRLQLIISVSLLASFALIGTITTVYLADIYRKKNDDFLAEKTQSLIVELEHKLKDLPISGQSMRDYLNQILLKFSLVFFSDINLYDVEGKLLATSRPEIFELGLTGEMMHPGAFRAMHIQNRLYLRQYEEIGKAGFISAYAPFKNSFGEVIAYVNLPYFVKETEMQREVRSVVLSYLNIFLLLSALSVLFALFVSRRLTQPLQMIQQKMSRVQLGHANEKINYQRYDEIGELVNQYNTLLDQLALSADLLARSERESAWREMARQVAHEIKNPLTPMRLSVQYLLRAWDDKDPDIDQKLKNIAQTLISQIDTLSSIASAFSDFAVMPQPKPVKLDLAEVLRKVINLFDHQPNIHFTFNLNTKLPTMVEADPENLNRIFTNLIKNSIQAIGSKPNAHITINLGENENANLFLVEVEDTGKGMTEEEARKVFTPNFTTKSSGMGMGLSIVYSLVQQAGGKISFKTKPGEGTSFTVELPKAELNT